MQSFLSAERKSRHSKGFSTYVGITMYFSLLGLKKAENPIIK